MIGTDVVGLVSVFVVGSVALIAVGWLAKHPIRWLWRTNVAEPIGRWGRSEIGVEIDIRLEPVRSQVEQLQEAVGPKNGSTIGDKVSSLVRVQAQILSMIDSSAAASATEVEALVHAEHEQTRAEVHSVQEETP